MNCRKSIILWCGILLLAPNALTAQTAPSRATLQTARIAKLGSMPRTELIKQLGKSMTFEGFYYDGSVPMIVEDMSILTSGMPMPTDKYLLLGGTGFSGVKSGTKVKITGLLQKPGSRDPAALRSEEVFLKVADSKSVVKLADSVQAVASPTDVVQKNESSKIVKSPVEPVVTKYAVLIGGGPNPANNFPYFWNDIKYTYRLLIANGYKPSNIGVYYANGIPRDSSTPVHGPATGSNISYGFTQLGHRMKATDVLFVGLYGQSAPATQAPDVYWFQLWNNQPLRSDQLTTQVDKIKNYRRMIILLNQPRSGLYLQCLAGPNRVVIGAAATDKFYVLKDMTFTTFNACFLSAHYERTLYDNSLVNADKNDDGKISIVEAYNFAVIRVPSVQSCIYEDDGVAGFKGGTMPKGAEGELGLKTYL